MNDPLEINMNQNVTQNLPSIGFTLDEISDLVSRHMIVRNEEAKAAALWVAHTYVFKRFQHTPRLAITSPEKQCGKSTLLKILFELSYNPLKTDNITPAAIFRAIGASNGMTMLIDEADTFFNGREEIRGILNSGFEETGSVSRTEASDGTYKPRNFSTFCPVAIAGIGLLPSTIMDRAVSIRLKRKAPGEKVERLPRPCPEFDRLKGLLQTWGDAVDLSQHLNPDIPVNFEDRQADISIPLLAIADSAGGDWPMAARVALSEIFGAVGNGQEAASASSILLADIRDLFDASGQDFVSSADICLGLAKIEDHPWGEWNRGRPISKHDLAGLLVPFGIRPFQRRLGQVVTRGYRHEDFADAWLRYTPKA
jgi:hypothetical protein